MDSRSSSKHLQEIAAIFQQNILAWLLATFFIFVSSLTIMRLFSSTRRHRVPQQSVVIDKKEGIRELNPTFEPTCDRLDIRKKVTMYDSICEAVIEHAAKHPDEPAFGFHKRPTDPYQWIGYKDFLEMVTEFGSGLSKRFGINPGDKQMMGIFGTNCVEWLVAHFGMVFYANIAVPLYSTLGDEAIIHIVKLVKMSLCICRDEDRAASLLEVLLKASKAGDEAALQSLKHIIVMQPTSAQKMNELRDKFKTTAPAVDFQTMEEVRQDGRQHKLPHIMPKPEDTYVINFTSGTTGTPKGVIVTCSMFLHIIKSVLLSKMILDIWTLAWLDDEDIYFSFLPLAHIMEQTLMAAAIFARAKVGFYSGEMTKIMDDIGSLQPTMLALVPRLLIRIYDSTITKLAEKHIPKFVFDYAVRRKLLSVQRYGCAVNNTIWDWVFFRTLQKKLGGRLRQVLVGSSACPPEVLNFARAAFGAVVHQGYGSTESGGAVALTFSDDISENSVGALIPGIKVKLADVPEMDLFPSRGQQPIRGEICVKGPNCTPGYYKDPEKTAELLDKHGWLHTGDVGEWDEMGRLKVVDRCKNLFKLSQGEYVAPDRVESIYATSPFVAQVFLDGKSDCSFAIAIVHPVGPRLAEKLHVRLDDDTTPQRPPNGHPVVTMDQLCKMPEANKFILNELNTIGRASGLAGFELAKKIHLIDEPFSIERGLMTATMKPVRGKIRQFYSKQITQLYQSDP